MTSRAKLVYIALDEYCTYNNIFTWMMSFFLCLSLLCSMSHGKNVIAKNTCTYLCSHKSVQVMLYDALFIKLGWRYTRTKKDWIVKLGLKIEMVPDWCSSVDWGWAVNQRVASSIPSQGTCLCCRPSPRRGHIWEATTRWYFSPSLSPSLPSL